MIWQRRFVSASGASMWMKSRARINRASLLVALVGVTCSGQVHPPTRKASSVPKPVVSGIPNTDNHYCPVKLQGAGCK
jgi:hypothetical protein